MPQQQRHLFWREIVAEAFPGMTAHAPEGIRADLARWTLGPAGLARARSGRACVSRIAGDGPRHLLFHLQRRGRMVMTHEHEAISVGVGDIIVADDSRPYRLDISEGNDCLILQLPIEAFDTPRGEEWHGRSFRAADPNVAFLGHMLQGLWAQREIYDGLDEGAGQLLADAARLVVRCGAVATEFGNDPSPVEYALNHLCDPALGTAMICEATGLSSRAVQKAFLRHTGRTPTGFITERRLDRAADLLSARPDRTITEIAFDMGFNDAGFFSRCFRRHFGVTPREWRALGNSACKRAHHAQSH